MDQFTTPLITALIAAVVSLIVSLLTHYSNRRKLRSEEKRHSIEQRRKLTEKLMDLRLRTYPEAFAITDDLTSTYTTKNHDLSPAHVEAVKMEIIKWNKEKGAFLLTKASIRAYRNLISSLTVTPETNEKYSNKQRDQMWRCKNRFRGALKSDLKLFYEEDETEPEYSSDKE